MKAVHLNDYISFNVNANVAIHVDSLISANITVYTYVYPTKDGGFKTDAMDCEIDWLLNGERVKSEGFRDLYTKLYGEDKLHKLQKDVCTEAEKLIELRVSNKFKDIINEELK
ncbi:MAG: hypothetical protein GY823_09285 [Flavobacteriaceae bacterium]|nr:hypothetical protein [Flavobacteriaceae bacterium]